MFPTFASSSTTIEAPPLVERDRTSPLPSRRSSADETTTTTRKRGRQGLCESWWEVRIYNDGLNTREHVARSLVRVTGMSELDAYRTMMRAHQDGIAVVGRYAFEIAESYHEALRHQGIVCDIVPVEEDS